MIVDRYDPMNLFELVPKLELEMEPELARLDGLLDDDIIFERVRADLRGRYPNSARLGRHSTPAEVILRMLVVKRLYGFSYEQTERFVSDSIVLRQVCRLYLEAAPRSDEAYWTRKPAQRSPWYSTSTHSPDVAFARKVSGITK